MDRINCLRRLVGEEQELERQHRRTLVAAGSQHDASQVYPGQRAARLSRGEQGVSTKLLSVRPPRVNVARSQKSPTPGPSHALRV